MTLLVLRQHLEVRHVGIHLLRAGHVVLARTLEVQDHGVESPIMRITGSVAYSNLCNTEPGECERKFAILNAAGSLYIYEYIIHNIIANSIPN